MLNNKDMNEYCVLPLDTLIEPHFVKGEKIAIVIHLFYQDTLEYYCNYIREIPSFIDVYITYSEDVIRRKILAFLEGRLNFKFIKKKNRGRDISALLVASRAILLQYDYIAFLHDKKSNNKMYDKDVFYWSDFMWKNILGSNEYILNIIYTLKKHKNIGLLVPPIFIGDFLSYGVSNLWGNNFINTVKLCERIGVQTPLDDKISPMAIGTIFWARCEAIKKLLTYDWKYEDFPDEPMPIDGTISHAIERCLSYVVEDSGYEAKFVLNNLYAGYRLNKLEKLLKDYFYLDNCEPMYRVKNRARIKNILDKSNDIRSYRRKVYIFGVGRVFEKNFIRIYNDSYVNVIGLVENDVNKCHKTIHGMQVISPQELKFKTFDGVVISSNKYYEEISNQLVLLGVPRWNILRLYQIFYKDFCDMLPPFTWCEYLSQTNHKTNDMAIYVIAHKDFCNAKNFVCDLRGYKLFFIGKNSAYLGDKYHCEYEVQNNDNIAELNMIINECTAMYWIWKHSTEEIVAINQYRRFWRKPDCIESSINSIASVDIIQDYLLVYDFVVAEPFVREERNGICNQLYETIDDVAFEAGWNIMLKVIEEKQPEYLIYFRQVMEGCLFFPCNMFATRKEIFNEYCEWLFSFIIDAAKMIDVSEYDDYSKRVIGFFAERMLTVWLMAHNYKIKTLPILFLDDSELVED